MFSMENPSFFRLAKFLQKILSYCDVERAFAVSILKYTTQHGAMPDKIQWIGSRNRFDFIIPGFCCNL
jgi:hypothetical protein